VTIEILVDPEAENYQQFHQGLEKQIGALNVEYSRGRVQAPPKTLSVEHDIVRYVINHPEILKLLPYIIELVRTTLERWKVKADTKNPPAVIIVNGKTLKMPASPNSQKRFTDKVQSETTGRTKPKAKSKRKG
jgi:hypothetical protein